MAEKRKLRALPCALAQPRECWGSQAWPWGIPSLRRGNGPRQNMPWVQPVVLGEM